MSVINKVLRDLDKRQGVTAVAPTAVEQGVRSGTASIEIQEPAPRAHRAPAAALRWGAVGLPALMLLLVGGGVALWQSGVLVSGVSPITAMSATSAPPATQPTAAASGLVAKKPDTTTDPTQTRQTTQSALASASRFESSLVIPKDVKQAAAPPVPPAATATVLPTAKTAAPLPTKTPVATAGVTAGVASMPAVALPPPVAAEISPPSMTSAVTASTSVPAPAQAPAPSPAELAQKQQLAARDALAQAQSLWNAGARDAAVDLLQQALASTERTAQTAPGNGSTQTLVLLVREFGRMQMAEGRPGAVWETLNRLEPLLRNEPEMWALRANAAQRLGRHQDSVHAYMTALQSRPNEQRWVLGTAVSLAALGQTTSAADMAERARTLGPISRDVQTYLRQMGVPLKD